MTRLRLVRHAMALATVSLALGVAPASAAQTISAPDHVVPAPILTAGSGTAILGRYLVVLADNLDAQDVLAATAAAQAAGGTVRWTYLHAINGFAATLPAAALSTVRLTPGVRYVEQDSAVSLPAATVDKVQPDAPWGLDRMDQRNLPLDTSYHYRSTGLGVTAYIVDTGVRSTHTEFGTRVQGGFTAIDDGVGTEDCNGHGTHSAGLVGGSTYGAAKKVTLVPVRVLDCTGSGSYADVIAGIDWLTGDADGPAVASVTLGGSASVALDDAVNGSISAGVSYAVTAGSSAGDACNYSPARVERAITVSGTTRQDAMLSSANGGPCVDLLAPGGEIVSAWYTSDTATTIITGTSRASSFTAGVAALYLQRHPAATPQTVAAAIVQGSSKNKVSSLYPGTPNRLLFSRIK